MARQATRAFTETRGARMADMRKRSDEQKAAERAAGTRRTSMVVDVADVREGDMVVVKGQTGFVEFTEGAEVESANGKTFVQRFVTEG